MRNEKDVVSSNAAADSKNVKGMDPGYDLLGHHSMEQFTHTDAERAAQQEELQRARVEEQERNNSWLEYVGGP